MLCGSWALPRRRQGIQKHRLAGPQRMTGCLHATAQLLKPLCNLSGHTLSRAVVTCTRDKFWDPVTKHATAQQKKQFQLSTVFSIIRLG